MASDPRTCVECGLPIPPQDQGAKGRDGWLHYRCFKLGTMHPRIVVTATCDNCGACRPENDECFQCGVGPRIGVADGV